MFFERFIPQVANIAHSFRFCDINPCDFGMLHNLHPGRMGCGLPFLGGMLGQIGSHLYFGDPFMSLDRFALGGLSTAINLAENGIGRTLPFLRRGLWCANRYGRYPYGGYGGGIYGGGYGGGFGGYGGGFGGGGGGGYGGGGYDGGYGNDCSDGGAPLGPGQTVQARQLFDYFLHRGLNAAQACGILGNMQTESGFKTDAYNPGENAIGLCQWEGGRRTDLENFASRTGRNVLDWMTQADFVMHELQGKERSAFSSLLQANTPQHAARIFQSQYERSAALTNRADNAARIYSQFSIPT